MREALGKALSCTPHPLFFSEFLLMLLSASPSSVLLIKILKENIPSVKELAISRKKEVPLLFDVWPNLEEYEFVPVLRKRFLCSHSFRVVTACTYLLLIV